MTMQQGVKKRMASEMMLSGKGVPQTWSLELQELYQVKAMYSSQRLAHTHYVEQHG
jgi:hypothetical protein